MALKTKDAKVANVEITTMIVDADKMIIINVETTMMNADVNTMIIINVETTMMNADVNTMIIINVKTMMMIVDVNTTMVNVEDVGTMMGKATMSANISKMIIDVHVIHRFNFQS